MQMKIPEEVIHKYFDNNANPLYKLVDTIVEKNSFNWLTEIDKDALYAIATDVFFAAGTTWESEKSKFDTFLYRCIENKIKSYVTSQNRIKRGGGSKHVVRIDDPIDDDSDTTIGDMIASPYNLEEVAIENCSKNEKTNADRYMESLTKTERMIVRMIMAKIPYNEIRSRLNLSKTEFDDHMANIRSSDRKRILTNGIAITERKEAQSMSIIPIPANNGKFKPIQLSAARVSEQIKTMEINANHPQQRQSDQWAIVAKSDLIVTMLHGFLFPKIVLAEQIKGGFTVRWIVDGKQRVTTISDYLDNRFKISKKSQNTVVRYEDFVFDENGKQIVKAGFPVTEVKEFDVKGKNFSQLPPRLQKQLTDYEIGIDLYLNCTDEEVEYHILRYNQAKPMNVCQKGITHLGLEFARIVKDMSHLSFFTDECGKYTPTELSNGTIERVISESIMSAFFLSDWKKTSTDAADYLKDHATSKEFEWLRDAFDRLSNIGTEKVKDMFTAKDTFLWMAAFKKFDELGIDDDEKFIDFMDEFNRNLYKVPVDGKAFEELCGKGMATKDKSVVKRKMSIIETLMYEYLGIEKEEELEEFEIGAEAKKYVDKFAGSYFVKDVLPSSTETGITRIAMQSLMVCAGQTDFSDRAIQKNLKDFGEDLREREEDVFCYLDHMNINALEVELSNKLYEECNIPAVVGLYDYAYLNDTTGVEFDKFVIKFAETFSVQKPFSGRDVIKNKNVMIEKLEEYLNYLGDHGNTPNCKSA